MSITKIVLVSVGGAVATGVVAAVGYFKGKSDGLKEAMNGELAKGIFGEVRPAASKQAQATA